MQPDTAVLDRVMAAYGVRLVSLVDVHGGADAGAAPTVRVLGERIRTEPVPEDELARELMR